MNLDTFILDTIHSPFYASWMTPTSARVLDLLRRGPATSADLSALGGWSQPTLSRALRSLGDVVLVSGRARNTRYAARREVRHVRSPVAGYEVRPPGERPRHGFDLHPVRPAGWWAGLDRQGEFVDDLPWFLDDVRPSGFLGRLVPRRHLDLDVPADVSLWSADDVIRWASRHGWNLPGAFVLGDDAFRDYLRAADMPPDAVAASERTARYPALAEDVLSLGTAGSSAAGEQPKFLVTRVGSDGAVPVLVKFSPPVADPVSERYADLLVAEHVALRTLAGVGVAAARSCLVRSAGRVFLEVERFDRLGPAHRRGLVSLGAVDAAFVGSRRARWSDTTGPLAAAGSIAPSDHLRTRWLERFGDWIANDDMHSGNLSFHLDGTDLDGLSPVYDMGPAAFAPLRGELPHRGFAPSLPGPSDADVAPGAWSAARAFWQATADHADASLGFRAVARDADRALAALEPALARLPTP